MQEPKDSTGENLHAESFVRATGGGKGDYKREPSDNSTGKGTKIFKVFNQEEACNAPEGFSLGFGRIKFEQNDESKPYIRVPWNINNGTEGEFTTHPKMLMHFVENVWGLEPPNLVVSITGAATDSLRNSDDLQHLLLDLMDFARRTSAWIITGGTHGGIMKLIGWNTDLLIT